MEAVSLEWPDTRELSQKLTFVWPNHNVLEEVSSWINLLWNQAVRLSVEPPPSSISLLTSLHALLRHVLKPFKTEHCLPTRKRDYPFSHLRQDYNTDWHRCCLNYFVHNVFPWWFLKNKTQRVCCDNWDRHSPLNYRVQAFRTLMNYWICKSDLLRYRTVTLQSLIWTEYDAPCQPIPSKGQGWLHSERRQTEAGGVFGYMYCVNSDTDLRCNIEQRFLIKESKTKEM